MTNNRLNTSTSKVFVAKNSAAPFLQTSSTLCDSRFWRWGADNLFPQALALISRRSTTHRRIINDKADYISGKGFTFDEALSELGNFAHKVNGGGESLRQLLNKVAFDKSLFGNAFIEVVTDSEHSFLSLFHQDASTCRLAKDSNHIILHHNWAAYSPAQSKTLALYPNFEQDEQGYLRSIIHYKDYEPGFKNYGIPPYIAGLNVSAIAYKTDEWNISRLDNSFQLSGVMILDSNLEDQAQAHELMQTAQQRFAGKPGQVMFMIQQGEEYEKSRFIPITSSNEGDWKDLHDQANSDIVVAHSWFRSLSGIDYSSGFSSERILHEYEIALNTVILPEQEELLEPLRAIIKQILEIDASSLKVINRPPTRSMPNYMRVWEARKADNLEYDPEDEREQAFISQI